MPYPEKAKPALTGGQKMPNPLKESNNERIVCPIYFNSDWIVADSVFSCRTD
jgi:hypothetical protein